MMIIQIDGENFAVSRTPSLLEFAQWHGSWQEIHVYTNEQRWQLWLPYKEVWNLRPHIHDGGWQAADRLLRMDARCFHEAGERTFLLGADDGDYAALAKELISEGSKVFVVGSEQISRRLKEACTRHFIASLTILEEGLIMPYTHEKGIRSEHDIASYLYHAPQLPDYLTHMLQAQLHHCLTVLSEQQWMTQRPQVVIELLQQIAQDPIFSLLLTGERGPQWERLINFAQQCDKAYEQGMRAATVSSPLSYIVNPDSMMGLEIWQQTQLPADQSKISGQPALQQARERWYQIGQEQQRETLHQVAHHPWQPDPSHPGDQSMLP